MRVVTHLNGNWLPIIFANYRGVLRKSTKLMNRSQTREIKVVGIAMIVRNEKL